MIDNNLNVESHTNYTFDFKKKPDTLWKKISNGVKKISSPLLFTAGLLTAYNLYHHAEFFYLTNIFLLIRLVAGSLMLGISLIAMTKALLVLTNIMFDPINKKNDIKLIKTCSIAVLALLIGQCIVL